VKTLAKATRPIELVQIKQALAGEIKQRRKEAGLSQSALAALMGSSQPRVAQLEAGGATIDLMCTALFALGVGRGALAKILSKAA
jgi:transcriptional regulator with XRE-family HTH domain